MFLKILIDVVLQGGKFSVLESGGLFCKFEEARGAGSQNAGFRFYASLKAQSQ